MKTMFKSAVCTCVGVMLFSGLASASSVVTTGYPYLKELPYSGQGDIYGDVPKGTKLEVLENTNKYYIKVRYDGQTGYISTKYVDNVPSGTTPADNTSNAGWEKKADRIIADAKRLIGKVEYKYGENDPRNLEFDCSSFTKYLFAKQGISLRWGARIQYKMGTPISKSQLRKGDLVFLSTSKTAKLSGVNEIGHVAIYMGNNKIIHALNPKSDVTISDLNSSWWKNHYVASARVIK
ncbi:C40 family peptidase [Paenibacillus harenae]|uniref:C40 family peptidase n=1 Tax=Paenibacillus harenae TaxID=306543 RepID=UPI000A032FF0|nr:C40 family peptidase [Paenibacillus harenae]